MPNINDPDYLRSKQYRDASNLNARVRLHALYSTNPYDWFLWVFDQYRLPPTCRILELGCGSAETWRKNLPRISTGWEILLSDFSTGMLDQARQNAAGSHAFSFLAIDAQSIPFEDHCFDVVIANHMLYHLPDRPRALSEIRRVLKTGGRFYATTVGEKHMQELLALPGRFAPGKISDDLLSTNQFTLENGAAQLQPYFNSVEQRRYPDALRVTEAGPLVDYIKSGFRANSIDVWTDFKDFVQEALDHSGGALHITKDSGIFIASEN